MANSPWLSSTPQLLLSLNGTRQSIRYSREPGALPETVPLPPGSPQDSPQIFHGLYPVFSPRIPASMVLPGGVLCLLVYGIVLRPGIQLVYKTPAYFPSPVGAYAWPRLNPVPVAVKLVYGPGSPSGICRQSIFPQMSAFTVCSMSQGRSNRNLCATASSAIRRIWAHSPASTACGIPLHHFARRSSYSPSLSSPVLHLHIGISAHRLDSARPVVSASLHSSLSGRHPLSPLPPALPSTNHFWRRQTQSAPEPGAHTDAAIS